MELEQVLVTSLTPSKRPLEKDSSGMDTTLESPTHEETATVTVASILKTERKKLLKKAKKAAKKKMKLDEVVEREDGGGEEEEDEAEEGGTSKVLAKLDEVAKGVEARIDAMSRSLMEALNARVRELVVAQEEMKGEIFELKTENSSLKQELTTTREKASKAEERAQALETKVFAVEAKINDLEQRGRRNNIRIFGVPEKKNETVEGVETEVKKTFKRMGLDVGPRDIEVVHRVGRRETDSGQADSQRPRPIIVRMNNRRQVEEIIRGRRALKGTGLSIAEDLTRKNYILLQRAQHTEGVIDSWTRRGYIYIKKKDGGIKKIDSELELGGVV